MSWKKFNPIDSSTWPMPDTEVLWKIKISEESSRHLVGQLDIHTLLENRPSVWDPYLKAESFSRDFGAHHFLDQGLPVYWMDIPSVDGELEDISFSPEIEARIEEAIAQAEKDIEAHRKNCDHVFHF